MIEIEIAGGMRGTPYAEAVTDAWSAKGPQAVPAMHIRYAARHGYRVEVMPDPRCAAEAAVEIRKKRIIYPGEQGEPEADLHLHEFGHIFDYGERRRGLSATGDFKAAYEADRARLSGQDILAFDYFLSHDRGVWLGGPAIYGAVVSRLFGRGIARGEVFAELLKNHVAGATGQRHFGTLSAYMPRSAELVGRFHDQVFGIVTPMRVMVEKPVRRPAAQPLSPTERAARKAKLRRS